MEHLKIAIKLWLSIFCFWNIYGVNHLCSAYLFILHKLIECYTFSCFSRLEFQFVFLVVTFYFLSILFFSIFPAFDLTGNSRGFLKYDMKNKGSTGLISLFLLVKKYRYSTIGSKIAKDLFLWKRQTFCATSSLWTTGWAI